MSVSRFLEFLIVGVVFGVIEDIIAITLATNQKIDLQVIMVTLVAAVPFAILSEIVVDHEKFRSFLKSKFGKTH
ncbi:hypothetical protein A3H85_02520 [Candidatus Daviesbacteria bacterium RIFCSPLOWO2_02_FULL_40_8]|uniref:Cation/H+ exchanger domain-containing protein n=1 Tax=Candidatus Daviesbacteria bacterium RIFCSPLOWO2_01_FULL_40_24 TaxID=1797787 RepID=A0A1F5MIH3_9BACT|nr:MAG: hypothetical protein A2780_03250 [Candidatus Daviesbacteria bacterium RIFCSPHIGHO2_01_FULL_41_45]OGE34164.1 MAG: hypothetical protein A3C32_00335 [Candidatus Daviesbacteria bacterium RIFCSPHIGHO2_02_FULL_41_14]OGE65148.1 MAG: hypothetical protein A3B49_01285 [Candidatus Daviesbacteria bacterium RIFCSPLOWO2_01_FULL_40_24]OGE66852.1 MAG: hypothetical protein A3H85_02520 [Candidatus Daviesbacteria bacterium RIFCSPLOWO2_02_FULL_40_8]